MANTKVTGDLIASSTIATGNIADNAVTSDKISGITTAHIAEGSNLYYTDARADARVALIVDSAPATLDTLNELAAALGDDPNFATTTANSIGLKAPLASPSFTGNASFAGSVNITGGTTNGLNITTSGTQNTIKIDRAATSDNAITKYQTASADKWIVGLRNTGDDNFRFYSYGTSSDVLTINQSNGNATFAGKITSGNDIVNATTGVYTWTGDTDTFIQRSAANEITFKTGASNALILDSSQNATFAGNVEIDGNLTVDGAIIHGGGKSGIFNGYSQITANTNAATLFTVTRESAGQLIFDVWITTFSGSMSRYVIAHQLNSTPIYNKLLEAPGGSSSTSGITIAFDNATSSGGATGNSVACKITTDANWNTTNVNWTVQVGYLFSGTLSVS